YSQKFRGFYGDGNDFFALASTPPQMWNDTLYSDMYYDQFLAWFGASVFGGIFTNVWDDLKDGVPDGPPSWVTRPKAVLDNWNINASVKPFTLTSSDASFNRSLSWTVTLKHDTTGETIVFGGISNAVNVTWYGLNETNGYMPQGWYTLTISAGNLNNYTTKVWLGRPYAGNIPNLREGNRLLVDDFADGDLIPYIGKVWETFTDDGHSGAVMNPSVGQLRWNYEIRDGGSWPFISLEWRCDNVSLTGVDTIIVTARSGGASPLPVKVFLIDTYDPNDYQYFASEITLTTASQSFALPLNTAIFKQRYDGSNRDFGKSIAGLLALRFHLQKSYLENPDALSGAIIVEKMYLAGPNNVLSGIYTPPPPPPDYIEPDGEPDVGVKRHQTRQSGKYSIKKTGSQFILTVPRSMAGADARIVNVKGVVVKRVTVPQSGQFAIPARDFAAGVYFVEVRKAGVKSLRLSLGNVK
ncbi:MAG: hypothetical protein LBB56_03055, partial [Chitinispirillales bacterium]|nr:hypothetical protein [Chitinispirillales bacterium]